MNARIKVLALASIAALSVSCNRRAPMAVDSTPPNSSIPADATISSSEVPADYDADLNNYPSGAGTSEMAAGDIDYNDGIAPETQKTVVTPMPKRVNSTPRGGVYRDSWLDEKVTMTDDSTNDATEDDFAFQEEQARIDTVSGTTGAGVTEMDRLKQKEALIEMNKNNPARWPVATSRAMNDRLNITTIGTTLPENYGIK